MMRTSPESWLPHGACHDSARILLPRTLLDQGVSEKVTLDMGKKHIEKYMAGTGDWLEHSSEGKKDSTTMIF